MTWAEYAKFVGLAESALYRLVAGGKPSRLTLVKIQQAQRLPVLRRKVSA